MTLNPCGADSISHLPLDESDNLQYSTTLFIVSYDVSGVILGIFEVDLDHRMKRSQGILEINCCHFQCQAR